MKFIQFKYKLGAIIWDWLKLKVRLITVKPPYNAVSIKSRDDFICNSDITLTTSQAAAQAHRT